MRPGECGLVHAFVPGFLWGDPGDHYRAGLGQVVIGRLTVKDLRLAYDVEFIVGTDGRKLCRSIQRRVGAKGFVVVEQKCRARG